MAHSRLSRVEERKAQKRLFIAVIGSIALLVLLGFFGLKILVGFSLLVDRIRGSSPVQQIEERILRAPTLDPLPEATHSASLTVTGSGEPNATLVLTVNGEEFTRLTIPEDGKFSVVNVTTKGEQMSVFGIITDDKGNESPPSNIIQTIIDKKVPELDVTKPEDDTSINDGTHRVLVEGKTDEDARLTISGRLVVVRGDGSFSYTMQINDGQNTLVIIARDAAGNETKVERHVTYIP